jgi:acylphosphatase
MKTRRIIVKGRVQGVFFRDFTESQARGLGLKGHVRNLPSGDVEIIAQGPEKSVNELVRRCRQGPPASRVESFSVEEVEKGPYQDFSVAY